MAAPRNVSGNLQANAAGAGGASTTALPFAFAEGSDAILQLGHYSTVGSQITGITIGGVAGTVIVQQNKLGGGNNSLRSYLFRGIPAGANSVVISYSAGTDHYTTFAVSEWASGVIAAASPIDTPTIATAFSTGGSLTVTTAAATAQASSLVFASYIPDTSRANNNIGGPTEPGWNVLWVEQDSVNVTGSTGAWIERTVAGTQAATFTIGTSGSRAAHIFAISLNTGGGGGDTTAPVLSSPTATATGTSTATGSVSTDTAEGTLYRLATTSPTATVAAVKAGASGAVTASGTQSGLTFTGLSPSTTYYPHYVHTDVAGNDSAVASGAAFTTDAPPPPPTLISPTRTSIQANSVSVGATSDLGGAGHAFHVAVGTSASAPTGAQIEAGSGGTIVAAATGALTVGANSLTVSGLSPNTTYYPYAVAENASGYSNVLVGASFTTPALSPVVTGVSSMTPARGGSLTITGTNFGVMQGTREVRINGVVQTVTAWGDTSITVTVVRGNTLYGQAVGVSLFEGGSAISNSFAITGLLPQAGWSYVVVGTPNTTAAARITAVADPVSGDQAAYDTVGGLVVLNTDLTFQSQEAVTSFEVEIGNADGWGAVALQTISSPVLAPKGVVGVIALFL